MKLLKETVTCSSVWWENSDIMGHREQSVGINLQTAVITEETGSGGFVILLKIEFSTNKI